MYGFYRVAVAVPKVRVADAAFNAKEIISLMQKAEEKKACLVAFPELCVTGYTCADLFLHTPLLEAGYAALEAIRGASEKLGVVAVIGAPLVFQNRLYNSAVVIQGGRIVGAVPKSYLANYKEFYEKRWFASGVDIKGQSIEINGQEVAFGVDLLFRADRYFAFGIEICEDLWSVIPPSSYQAAAGALLCVNLSASNELVAKSEYRVDLVKNQSARCVAAYLYTSSGTGESTTDLVYGGHAMIAENGTLLAENKRFQRESEIIFADVDCERLFMTRLNETSFVDAPRREFRELALGKLTAIDTLERFVDPHPFVPANSSSRDIRCREIFSIQSAALAKRIEHTGAKKLVIGVSGGLDSTLALLVCVEAMKLLGRDNHDIIAITMPGFGTTEQTLDNVTLLCTYLQTDFRILDISQACTLHFADIGHDPRTHDITYENVQARERTQVLMNIANKEQGFVVGTGDLSEIALGWSTYNGDHMSMYAVNAGVPKTLVRYLVQWAADRVEQKVSVVLHDILDTPISPELLPKKEGEMVQKTEEIIGPYELHDFFLYHLAKYGASPEKILFLATCAFGERYDKKTIAKWLRVFITRFFAQQFKRNCMPDGPKVGTIALSPRGDWRMPSDASAAVWLDRLEE